MNKHHKKSAERKADILETAQRLFNSRGFMETSVSDIMRAVGAAKGGFYYYFETKDQMIDSLVQQNMNEIAEAMELIAGNPEMNALQKLQSIIREEFRVNTANSDPENHLHNIKNVDIHQRIMVGMVKITAPIISRVIEQGVSEGTFKTRYPLEVSEIVVAGVHFVTDLGIFKWSREQYLKRVQAAEELIEKVLSIKEGGFAFLSDLLKGMPDRVAGKAEYEGGKDET